MQVVAGVLGRAGEAGQKLRLKAAAKGSITYRPARGLKVPGGEEDEDVSKELADARRMLGLSEGIADEKEFTEKLDEVNNREDHRVKGGRDIKASA